MGFESTQVQNPLFDKVGNTGAAFAPMILVGALEEAKPDEKILLANYGDGADAHVLQITDKIKDLRDRRGIKKHLESKLMLENYGKYIKFKGLMEFEETPEYRPRNAEKYNSHCKKRVCIVRQMKKTSRKYRYQIKKELCLRLVWMRGRQL